MMKMMISSRPPRRPKFLLSVLSVLSAAATLLLLFSGIPSTVASVTISVNNNNVQQPSGRSSRIKHYITLMMENRSFDHYLGWLKNEMPELDGIVQGMGQPVDPLDPSKGFIPYNADALDVGQDDPDHSFDGTAYEIFGLDKPVGRVGVPKMNGFVKRALDENHTSAMVTSMFNSSVNSAPILNTLAKEFAVFDRWFCSIPGPTDPNRGFGMSGTSMGMVTNYNGTHWSQQSFIDYVRVNNLTSRGYYQDDLWALGYFQDLISPENSRNIQEMDQFFKDAATGDLADFTWLQPRMTSHKGMPTWQHPDASVRAGERLIKEVYEALRASPAWEQVLLVITFDEHGGLSDHVPPPQTGIPSPDGIKAANGFNFDRLGVRIPTVAISPWINKGTIVHDALPNERPTATSEFDATSNLATARAILGITSPHLTNRMAWANTFVGLVHNDRSEPRSDCPKTLPTLPAETNEELEAQRRRPLNDHLELQLDYYCRANHAEAHARGECEGAPELLPTQGAASEWIGKQVDIFVKKLRAAEKVYDLHQQGGGGNKL